MKGVQEMLPKSLKNIRIDMNLGQVRKSVAINQNSSLAPTLNFYLVDAGNPIDLTDLLYAEIFIHKADDHEAINGCVIDGDSIQYTLHSTDVSAIGINRAQLQLTWKDGSVAITPTFEIVVYQAVLDEKVQVSTNEYTTLSQMIVQANGYMETTEGYMDAAEASKDAAAQSALDAATSAQASAQSAENSQGFMLTAQQFAQSAEHDAGISLNAEAWATGKRNGIDVQPDDDTYHNNSKYYSEQASLSQSAASNSAEDAEGFSEDSEAWARGTRAGVDVDSEDETYHNNAKYYAESMIGQVQEATAQASAAALSATASSNSATASSGSATSAAASSIDSEAWSKGTRAGSDVEESDITYHNNSKYFSEMANYYYLQAQAIAQGLAGALKPMGTIVFANLPALASANAGDMYNISDSFTTTSDFEEGAGVPIAAGANVYKTVGGKWDVLAGNFVSGVKGSEEVGYRTGNVNITKANVGLDNVANTGDSDTPIQGGTTKFTTGGAYTELNKKADKPTVMTATLAAGSTSVTFTQIPTTGDYTIELYTSAAGLEYTDVDDTTPGELTYTFEAQSAAVTCYLEIKGVA